MKNITRQYWWSRYRPATATERGTCGLGREIVTSSGTGTSRRRENDSDAPSTCHRRIRPAALLLILARHRWPRSPLRAQAASPQATHIVQLRDGVSLDRGPRDRARRARPGDRRRVPIIRGLAVRLSAGARARLARDPQDRGGQRQRADAFRSSSRGQRPPVRRRCDTTRLARRTRPRCSRRQTLGVGDRPGRRRRGHRHRHRRCAAGLHRRRRAVAGRRVGGDQPRRDDGRRTRTATGRTSRASSPATARGAARRPARRQVHRHRPAREPGRDQGLRRRRPRHDPRRDLRPPVRRRPPGRIQHPRRQPVAVVDGRRVLPDRPARRRGRVRVLPRHPRRRGGRQPRHRRRRDVLLARQRPVRAVGRRGRRPGHGRRAATTRTPTGPASASRRTDITKPEIAAPGAHIVSTLAPGQRVRGPVPEPASSTASYIRIGGTSMAAPVVSGVAALVFERAPGLDARAGQVDADRHRARRVRRQVNEVNAAAALAAVSPSLGRRTRASTPNELVDAAGGAIDYVRSSWGRSSWGAAPGSLVAGWARSSWGCTCPASYGGTLESTRSSWGSATWLARWDY